MSVSPLTRCTARVVHLVLLLLLLMPVGPSAAAATGYISTVDNTLYRFDTTEAPIEFIEIGPISGLQPTEILAGIDIRPANGMLYGLGTEDRLYIIDKITAAATAVNAAPFVPGLDDSPRFGVDFDPARDTLRVISESGQNLRIDPTSGDSSADFAIQFGTNIGALAYTDNVANAPTSTLYGMAPSGTMAGASDDFYRIGGIDGVPPADNGDLTFVNDMGFDVTDAAMDISDLGEALLVGQNPNILPGITNLYSVDVSTGLGSFVTSNGQLATASGGRITGFTLEQTAALPEAVAVPSLNRQGLIVLVLALGVLAGLALRHSRV